MNKHIVLIGLNYQSSRSTSDKNFWIELVPNLAKRLDRITIISIRDHARQVESYKIDKCLIEIEYISPRLLVTYDATPRKARLFSKGGVFTRRFLLLVEKTMNARRLARRLGAIYLKHPFQHVHLMDTLGPGNRYIARKVHRLNCSVSVSLMSYRGMIAFLNKIYVLISCKHSNLTTVASTKALREKLIKLGLNKENVHYIPWGINPKNNLRREIKQDDIQALGLPRNKPVFLWAGYIQQIRERDFFYAMECAMSALADGLNAIFYFAFKPEAMKSAYKDLHAPNMGIYVNSTNPAEFMILKSIANVFYSPVVNRDAILGPPLTWIEIMCHGVPILTTDIAGSDEIVVNGKTGFAAADDADMIEKINEIVKTSGIMALDCIDMVTEHYSITKIADEYIKLIERCSEIGRA